MWDRVRLSLAGLVIAAGLGGCAPYDGPTRPYTVDEYYHPQTDVNEYEGRWGIQPHPYHCFRCGWF